MSKQWKGSFRVYLGLAAAGALALAGCSDEPEVLRFSPTDGDERRYQLLSHTEISYGSGSNRRTEKVESTVLMDYVVEEQGDVYQLHMIPQYMNVDGGGVRFSSAEAVSPYEQEGMRDIISGGMKVTVDKASGEAVDFGFNRSTEEWDEQMLNPLRDLLDEQVSRPGFGAGIELREGAELEVEGNDRVPPITLTVASLSDDHASLRLRAEDGDARIYGYMLLERESGWPHQAVIVMELPFDEQGFTGTVRTVTAMKPPYWSSGLMLDHLSDFEPWEFDSFPSSADENDRSSISEEQVFSSELGELAFDWDGVRLVYKHAVEDFDVLGAVSIDDLQAFDSTQTPIEFDFHAMETFTFSSFRSSGSESNANVWPLGWRDLEQELEGFAGIEATVSWYGSDREVLALPLGDGVVDIERHGARAILTPGDEPGVYVLALRSRPGAYFPFAFDGPSRGMLDYPRDPHAPDWISDGESRLLYANQHAYYPTQMTLYFDEPVPEELRIPLILVDSEARAQRRVRFYDENAMLDDLSLAPPDSEPLYLDDSDSDGDDGRDFRVVELAELMPESFDRPQLYLTLSRGQAALCELEEAAGVEVAGRKLAWKEHRPYRGRVSMNRLPPKKIFLLASEDGEQTFFYQQEVDVTLRCAGEPEWQAMELDLGEREWLVRMSALLGEDWEGHELTERPLEELLDRYRFLDDQGRALAVLPPSSSARLEGPAVSSLKEYVTSGGMLRIAGRVHEIQQVRAAGEPIEHQWTHRFPDLPGYDGELHGGGETFR